MSRKQVKQVRDSLTWDSSQAEGVFVKGLAKSGVEVPLPVKFDDVAWHKELLNRPASVKEVQSCVNRYRVDLRCENPETFEPDWLAIAYFDAEADARRLVDGMAANGDRELRVFSLEGMEVTYEQG